MSYIRKLDANGLPINEGLERIEQVEIAVSTVLTDLAVTVPKGAFGFVVKSSVNDLKMKVNGQATGFTVYEGDKIGPFVKSVETLTISTGDTVTADTIILQFLI